MTRDMKWMLLVIFLSTIILTMQILDRRQSNPHYIIHVRGYTCTEVHPREFDCQKVENA